MNNKYFLVQHTLSINLQAVEDEEIPIDQSAFDAEIPGPFRMASDLAQADSSILAPLKLGTEQAQALCNYLHVQNQKLNTLLSYVLSQQDESQYRYQTQQFSAGCFSIAHTENWSMGQAVRAKIFLPEESSAIYCYAQVSEMNEDQDTFTYSLIREEDRELLIRASLHIQSQHLKERTKLRESQD